jgi:hypothetical protein
LALHASHAEGGRWAIMPKSQRHRMTNNGADKQNNAEERV